jgi:hypothetical protein
VVRQVVVADNRKARVWWRQKLVWGILFSILLGGLSLIIEGADADLKIAALIALVGLALTLAIELRFQIEESETRNGRLETAQKAFDRHLDRFVGYVSAPESCREFFAEISGDWHQVEEHKSVFLGWLRQDAENEFRVRLRELAAGHGTVDQKSRHYFRSHPLSDFSRIRSVDAKLTRYWLTARGRHYLNSQRSAITANGLDVSRVFVLGKSEIDGAVEIIRKNVQAGVKVAIVLREEITGDPDVPEIEDMSLVTDHSEVIGVLKPREPGEPELFTTEERQVARAEDLLDFLSPYARSVDDVFGGK